MVAPQPEEATTASGELVCHLDRLLTEHRLTLAQLSRAVGITQANLSVLKNNRARAIRFSTLSALCAALECQPGDLFTVAPPPTE